MTKKTQTQANAQGTIEYLVVIGVVVVISLIVVGLLTGLTDNSSTAKTAKKIGAYSSGISISDAAMDSTGDAIFMVRSNQGNDLFLSSVSVNGTDVTNTSPISQVSDSKVIISGVVNSCCLAGETGTKECPVVFHYSTPNLTNLSIPLTVTVECVEDVVVPIVVALDTVIPTVTLSYPLAGATLNQNNVDFNFVVSDAGGLIRDCNLILDGAIANVNVSSPTRDTNITLTKTGLSYTTHTWDVNCTDTNGNRGTSGQNRSLTLNVPDSTPPVVYLLSPANNDINKNSQLKFDFNFSDASAITQCNLKVNNVDVNTNPTLLTSTGYFMQSMSSLSDGFYDWNVSCTDSYNNTGISLQTRRLQLDLNDSQITYCLELSEIDNNRRGNYFLMNDINCTADTSSGGSMWNSGAGFDPIGDCGATFCATGDEADFNGLFDGLGHKIYGLNINRPTTNGASMFASIGGAGIVRNLEILDVNMVGNAHTGILAGAIKGQVSKVGVRGVVETGDSGVGGIAGVMSGSLSESYSSANVRTRGSTALAIGGLLGLTINASGATISNCYFDGNVYASRAYGLHVGGLVGLTNSGTFIKNSYSSGVVDGISTVGGLVGTNYSTDSNVFSVGPVIGAMSGGLTGSQNGTFSNAYWDTTLTTETTCYWGGSVNCNSTTNNPSYYYNKNNAPMSSWNFTTIWDENATGYPRLRWKTS
jgi:hypothetical protein